MTVFRTVCEKLGPYLRRIPDGETGERSNWIRWQLGVLSGLPETEEVPTESDRYPPTPRIRLREGVTAEDLSMPELGYSAAAIDSYETFTQLRDQGVIPAECRFQVSLPTPLAPIQVFVTPGSQAELEPVYEAKLMEELGEIIEAIPAKDLAIQWDTAVEFAILEGVWPSFLENPESDIRERLLRIGRQVPERIELGYHLCYGDAGHEHFTEPKDMGWLVRVANMLSLGLDRPLQWLHMPVPRDRDDVRYFSPLDDLRRREKTELYLGLVHYTDGVNGTERRIETAREFVEDFGVATECGFGRRPPNTIPKLLDIHASVAAPIRD